MPESLKNILLVMADGGYLAPPSNNEKPSEIWEETWKRINRFLPGLFREVFPEPRALPSDSHGKRPPQHEEASMPTKEAPNQEEPEEKSNEEQATS